MPIPKLPKPVPEVRAKDILAVNLRKYRHAQGLTQEALSYEAGMDRSAVGHIERGERNVTLSTLDRLAEALSVTPFQLVNQEHPAESPSDTPAGLTLS